MTERSGSGRVCPYCRHVYQPEAASINEAARVETCEQCGEEFVTWDEIDITHVTQRIVQKAKP